MPLLGAIPDGARLIAVLGDLPAVAGVPVLGVESLVLPFQTVGDNVLLGAEASGRFFESKQNRERRAVDALDRVGLLVSPTVPVLDLNPVDQRIVELAGVLGRTPDIVFVDDRSSSFDDREAARWQAALARAAEVAPVLVAVDTLSDLRFSPRAIDAVAVTRDGVVVGTAEPGDAGRLRGLLIDESTAPAGNRPLGPVVLELNDLSVSHPVRRERMLVEGVSLTVQAGEILGLAHAQSLVMGVFGESSGGKVTGTILLDGVPADLSTVERAISARVLFITEHPPTYDIGLIGGVPTNVSGESLARLARMGIVDRRREYTPRRAPSMLLDVISGGRSRPSTAAMNEVLAGWAADAPRVALITEPFAGLSPTDRAERRTLIERIAAAGAAVVLEAADPAQLVGLSDRILLQHGRRLATELRGEAATPHGLAAFRVRTDDHPET
ncbi:hypothetical protein [Mycetocola sp. 2940]|uniref:hypothetical protein n=1 Tax=Mycetocola sp. 2940 TaxID=3156452 RepID=UPI003395DD6B